MHFCRAMIAIAGDTEQIVYRDHYHPISWPEVQVLQYVHGETAVDRIEPFVRVEQSPRAERHRLAEIYGEKAVAEVYARSGPTEMDAPKATLQHGLIWKNPIGGELETVEAAPPAAPVPTPAASSKQKAA